MVRIVLPLVLTFVSAWPVLAQTPTQARLWVHPGSASQGDTVTLLGTLWADDGAPTGTLDFLSTRDGTLGSVALTALGPGQGQMVGGDDHTCVITGQGTVECWGWNGDRQLGDGTLTNRSTPVAVQGLPPAAAVQLALGSRHSCALFDTGAVWCWGYNSEGQLGQGDIIQHFVPVEVPGLAGRTVQIAAGALHTCAINRAGVLRCWGANASGQLGDGTTTRRTSPVAIPGLPRLQQVALGLRHSCGLSRGGVVHCWGSNALGQLGDGTNTDSAVPVRVRNGRRAVAIDAGDNHNCLVRSTNQRAFCWGQNTSGQLGNGTNTHSAVPVRVAQIRVSGIALGQRHSCALTPAGFTFCWGNNGAGQLGDGLTTESHTPVAVQFSSPRRSWALASLSAGTCAQDCVGALHCWGRNTLGQTGDGTTTSPRRLPVDVVGGAFAFPRATSFARMSTTTLTRGWHQLSVDYAGVAPHDAATSRLVRYRVRR